MSTGELLTRWTVRVALALYVASLVLRLGAVGRPGWLNAARLCWTAGCIVFAIHVGCAFHFYHQWSHRDAYEETARRTAEVAGFDWGGGLYANYAFIALWAADLCWWWYDAGGYLRRPRVVEWALHGFMGFLWFNATVVFGAGAIRWFGVGCSLVLAGALGFVVYRRYCQPASGEREGSHE